MSNAALNYAACELIAAAIVMAFILLFDNRAQAKRRNQWWKQKKD